MTIDDMVQIFDKLEKQEKKKKKIEK